MQFYLAWLRELDPSISFTDADTDDDSFEPTIVAGLGHRGSQALFMSVPPFAAAFFGMYFAKQTLCRPLTALSRDKYPSFQPSYRTATSAVDILSYSFPLWR